MKANIKKFTRNKKQKQSKHSRFCSIHCL